MPVTYYIDGYNVMHHSSILRPLAAQDFESARDALVDKVAAFCVSSGCPAKIVFDGRGRRTETGPQLPGVPGLEILYSHGKQTADALIERIVYSAPDRRSIVVVSADRGIRDFCRGLNALVMDPENFLGGAREMVADNRSLLGNLQRPDTIQRVENRLDQNSFERLKKIRDSLEG